MIEAREAIAFVAGSKKGISAVPLQTVGTSEAFFALHLIRNVQLQLQAATDPGNVAPRICKMCDTGQWDRIVIVVDDEPLVRLVAVDILESVGFRVFEAENGLAALSVVEAHPEIELLFSDVNMPGPMDGLGSGPIKGIPKAAMI